MTVTDTAASGGHVTRDGIELANFQDVGKTIADDAEIEDNDVEDEQTSIGLLSKREAYEERNVVDLLDKASTDELGNHWVLIDQQNEVIEKQES